MQTVYIRVKPAPHIVIDEMHELDIPVIGVYVASVPDSIESHIEDYVLDKFHQDIAIKVLDDVVISVFDDAGIPLETDPEFDTYSTDEPIEIIQCRTDVPTPDSNVIVSDDGITFKEATPLIMTLSDDYIQDETANEARAKLAGQTLISFAKECRKENSSEDVWTLMTDLISNLGHLSTCFDIDFDAVLDSARSTYVAELECPKG